MTMATTPKRPDETLKRALRRGAGPAERTYENLALQRRALAAETQMQEMEQRALAAIAQLREMEQRALASEAQVRDMQERALASEARSRALEAMLARLKKEWPDIFDASGALVAPDADERDARARLADAQQRARNLEERATMAEGRLREAQHHARDMEQRACAAEALIAGRW